jgi:hypothetical protein
MSESSFEKQERIKINQIDIDMAEKIFLALKIPRNLVQYALAPRLRSHSYE